MNEIVVGDLLTISDKKYIVLDKTDYLEEAYIFVNEMTDSEENTDNFYVLKIANDGVIIVEEKSIVNNLLSIFSDNMQKMVNKVFE